MDHTFFKELIENLDQSINEHVVSKDLFFTNCNCDNPEQIGKCFNCRADERIKSLQKTIRTVKEYSNNSIVLPKLIEAEAFRFALANHTDLKEVKCYPVFNDPNAELNHPDSEPDSFAIEAINERYAMDGNGYHVGYERVTFKWMAINKQTFGIICGIPLLLSRWVINPDHYEIESKDLPPNENPDHDSDCEFKHSTEFDNCDCAEFFEGYYRPDDDFFYQEINHIIEMMQIPEATFDSDKREWQLGDISFNLNEFQTIDEYAKSCQEDNGAPFTG